MTTASALDEAFARGARLFDEGAFFDAHEAWEEHWRIATDAGARRFLQGLIQVAAAFHKLVVVRSPASASRLLARGIAKLDASPDAIAGRGLEDFLVALHACAQALATDASDASWTMPRMHRE
ncbi:MAG TPA: DUF309 domain-containing protein [Polyangiaceae bacterium]